jgi:hypothetical protein
MSNAERSYERYEIQVKRPGQTEYELFWDALGWDAEGALKQFRRSFAFQNHGLPKGTKFRAVLSPGKLFGT